MSQCVAEMTIKGWRSHLFSWCPGWHGEGWKDEGMVQDVSKVQIPDVDVYWIFRCLYTRDINVIFYIYINYTCSILHACSIRYTLFMFNHKYIYAHTPLWNGWIPAGCAVFPVPIMVIVSLLFLVLRKLFTTGKNIQCGFLFCTDWTGDMVNIHYRASTSTLNGHSCLLECVYM